MKTDTQAQVHILDIVHSNLVIIKLKGDKELLRYIYYFVINITAINYNICHLGGKILTCK